MLLILLAIIYVASPCSAQIDCFTTCDPNSPPRCAVYNGGYRLFRNGCAVVRQNCDTAQTWAIVNLSFCADEVCPLTCTNLRNPVCATNGNRYLLFANPCRFMNYVCRTQVEWRPVNIGNCVQTRRRIVIRFK